LLAIEILSHKVGVSVAVMGFVRDLLRHCTLELRVFSLVSIDTVLNLVSETADETLNGPGGSVTKGANGVSFNLVRKFLKHVNLCEISISELHAFKHVNHPAGSFTAGGALSARLMSVELSESKNSVDNVSLLVHNNNSSCTESRPSILQIVKVHDGFVAMVGGKHGDRRATGNDSL
jgi:hypothetical protein